MNLAIALSENIETSNQNEEDSSLSFNYASELTEEETIEISLVLLMENQSSTERFLQDNMPNLEDASTFCWAKITRDMEVKDIPEFIPSTMDYTVEEIELRM